VLLWARNACRTEQVSEIKDENYILHSLLPKQETRWSNSDSVEEGPLSSMGRHLPRHIYSQSYVLANSGKAGLAATEAELKKLQKYQYISAGLDFIPVAIESAGV